MTEEHSIGYQEGYQDGWNAAVEAQPQQAPVQEPVHKLVYPGGGKALFNRLWHLTCNAVATQSGMRVRTDVMPMREMKEFLDHLCVLVDSPPQPVPAPVQEQQPAPASKPVLLQCLGCERVGTQEQLSASTDCDCWKHSQPLQDTTAYLDNLAVDRFAVAMKDKMAKQRARGYGGWHDADACPTKRLQKMLGEHVGKGDPVDVGNIAMMLWTRKEPTAAITQQPSLITKIGGHEIIEAADRADEGQENSEHLLAFGRGVGATVLTKLGVRV